MCTTMNLSKDNERNLPDNLLEFIRVLSITSGDHLGEKVEVLPYQERFIRGTFRPGIQTAALSIARGNGKSTLVGWLADSVLLPTGPLHHRNAVVIVAASSFEQGAIIHKAVVDQLPDKDNRERWSIWDSNRLRIRCKESGAELRVLSFSPGSAHGVMGGKLLLADEVAQWPRSQRDRMWTALESTLGKTPGCRLIAISTRPDDKDNPLSKLLDGAADYALEFRSRAGKGWDKDSAIRTANPALDHFPALRAAIERDRRIAKEDPAKIPAFRAYRLNQGTPEGDTRDVVLTAHQYAGLEDETVDVGDYVLGLDLAGGHAQNGVAAVSLDADPDGRHHVDAFAVWPETVKVKERSKRDDQNYAAMIAVDDLIQVSGPTVDVDQVITEAMARWGRPACVVTDYFRISESRHVLESHGYIEDDETLIYRRFGWGDGSEDLRGFRRMVASKSLRFRRSLLLRASFSVARTISDASGNEKMAKLTERGGRGVDDCAAAAVIAVAEVNRRYTTPVTDHVYVEDVPEYAW